MLTSLESIAEKLQEARRQKLEEILSVSGSLAATRTTTGITNINDDITTSLLFKKLDKLKLDNEQIKKAINVEFSELKPDIPVPVKDLVPKPIYDEQVTINGNLTKNINELNTKIDSLNSEIDNLKTKLQTEIDNRLDLEQSNDILINQSQTLSNSIDSFAVQIRNALQKSIEESIMRSNLQAQNSGYRSQIEALIKQVDSLNSIIEGLQSQLGAVQQQQIIEQNTTTLAANAGGFIVNDVAVVLFESKPPKTTGPQLMAKFNAAGGSQWMWGSAVSITNNDSGPITIKISMPQFPNKAAFFRPSMSEFTIEPRQSRRVQFVLNELAVSPLDSKRNNAFFGLIGLSSVGFSNSKSYAGGLINISVRRANNTTKEMSFETAFDKKHPNSY
jgi:hypothetical protein